MPRRRRSRPSGPHEDLESGDDEDLIAEEDVREWRIQCKRYKQLHPKALAAIVDNLVPDAKDPPHGILVAAAADVSAKAVRRSMPAPSSSGSASITSGHGQ